MENLTITTKKKINFFQLENELVDKGHLGQLKGAPLSVYIALSRHANYTTAVAYPSITKLEEETWLDRKSVIKAIKHLETLGYVVKLKKGGKDSGSNHYEIQELSTVTVGKKGVKNVTPPVAPKRAKKAPKEESTITLPTEEQIEAAVEGEVYKAYKVALDKWTLPTGVKPWKEETHTKKVSKHDPEVLKIAYSILANSINSLSRETAKVYLLSPDDMVTQLYPQIRRAMSVKKITAAKEEFAAKRNTVIATALKQGKVTQDDIDFYKENNTQTTNKRVAEITQILVGVHAEMGAEIAKAHGLTFLSKSGEFTA